MKHGDYTQLAKDYIHRAGYSPQVLDVLIKLIHKDMSRALSIAEIGAGTGKLTKQLLELGADVVAVEPNDAMREEGIKYTQGHSCRWLKGTAEETGLPSHAYDWVLMASSFHWTDSTKSLPEFSRILKPGGYLTVLWNPRDIERSQIEKKIEARIRGIVPKMKRKSSGASKYTREMDDILISTGHFHSPLFMEARHMEAMSHERYLGVWRSVNDVQVQAGKARWEKIFQMIQKEIRDLDTISVAYKTRSWTVQKR